MTELSEEEIKTLKDIAQNFQSASRVGKLLQTGVLWIAALIGGSVFLWEFFLKSIGKN